MIPNVNQQQVYHTFQTTDQHILIQAVAGSGKTTTLMGILELASYRTLFLAFNKSIQEEISHRIEQAGYTHARAMTLHSLGLTALRYSMPKVVVEKGKNYKLIKSLQDYNKSLFGNMNWEEKSKTIITLMEMNDVSRIYLTNEIDEITSYMTEMDKFFYLHPLIDDLWKEFLFIRESFNQQGIIDFIDMIYLVVENNLPIPVQTYYLMIDEAQDLSVVQHKFIDQFIAQGDIHKWIAVGDRRQAIYGFSGSDSNSFDLFREKENVIELPLDVCYRCPQLIIGQANMIYDVMEGFKQENGVVGTIINFDFVKDGSMVICRNSAPLINAYFELLAKGKKVFLKGDDILSELTRFLKPYQYKTMSAAIKTIESDLDILKGSKSLGDRDRFRMYKIEENLKNINLLSKNFCKPADRVDSVLKKVEQMFAGIADEDAIMLCTIHKSKGLEADIVYILDEFLIPSKFAKSTSQLEQERNLKYVARTRARKELYYLNIGKKPKEGIEILEDE